MRQNVIVVYKGKRTVCTDSVQRVQVQTDSVQRVQVDLHTDSVQRVQVQTDSVQRVQTRCSLN